MTEVIAVTGGNGFLARHLLSLIPKFFAESQYYKMPRSIDPTSPILSEIRMLDINISKDRNIDRPQKILIKTDKKNIDYEIQIKWIEADITNYKKLLEVFQGVSAVLHMASIIDGTQSVMDNVNFIGTCNVIKACLAQGVPRLIYTSTIDVTVGFETICECRYVSELDVEYPKIHLFPRYGVTKMKAELEVKRYDNCRTKDGHTLRTICLRPTAMYGPGDPHFISKALMRGNHGLCPNFLGLGKRKSRLFPVTDIGSALFQATYIGNTAWAHLKALDGLSTNADICGGEIFFVCDDTPPTNVYGFVKPFFDAKGIDYHKNRLPRFLVSWIRKTCHVMLYFFPFLGAIFPIEISAFLYLYANHVVSYEKAKKYLKYEPIYKYEEAMIESIEFYKNLDMKTVNNH